MPERCWAGPAPERLEDSRCSAGLASARLGPARRRSPVGSCIRVMHQQPSPSARCARSRRAGLAGSPTSDPRPRATPPTRKRSQVRVPGAQGRADRRAEPLRAAKTEVWAGAAASQGRALPPSAARSTLAARQSIPPPNPR